MLLGKFLPPHLGHAYLVDFARGYTDALTVVVGTLAAEPIPGVVRFRWMQELCGPGVRVLHLEDELPQDPSEHPQFWDLWRASLRRALGDEAPDLVFASEAYGARLASELGARFVPVDPGRSGVPVSGTAIRRDPMAHWRWLPRCVRPWYVRRVCVFGPESTGKTTLAARLADHFGTVWVPEYARTLIEHQAGEIAAADMPRVVRGQAASEAALARSADRLLICDTDPLTTAVWSAALFGAVADEVARAADTHDYDLTLLCDVDVPWVDDVARYRPDERRAFFESCRAELETRGRRFVVVTGADWDARFTLARDAVAQLLAEV